MVRATPSAGGVREPTVGVGFHTGKGLTHPAAFGEVVPPCPVAVTVRTALLPGRAKRR